MIPTNDPVADEFLSSLSDSPHTITVSYISNIVIDDRQGSGLRVVDHFGVFLNTRERVSGTVKISVDRSMVEVADIVTKGQKTLILTRVSKVDEGQVKKRRARSQRKQMTLHEYVNGTPIHPPHHPYPLPLINKEKEREEPPPLVDIDDGFSGWSMEVHDDILDVDFNYDAFSQNMNIEDINLLDEPLNSIESINETDNDKITTDNNDIQSNENQTNSDSFMNYDNLSFFDPEFFTVRDIDEYEDDIHRRDDVTHDEKTQGVTVHNNIGNAMNADNNGPTDYKKMLQSFFSGSVKKNEKMEVKKVRESRVGIPFYDSFAKGTHYRTAPLQTPITLMITERLELNSASVKKINAVDEAGYDHPVVLTFFKEQFPLYDKLNGDLEGEQYITLTGPWNIKHNNFNNATYVQITPGKGADIVADEMHGQQFGAIHTAAMLGINDAAKLMFTSGYMAVTVLIVMLDQVYGYTNERGDGQRTPGLALTQDGRAVNISIFGFNIDQKYHFPMIINDRSAGVEANGANIRVKMDIGRAVLSPVNADFANTLQTAQSIINNSIPIPWMVKEMPAQKLLTTISAAMIEQTKVGTSFILDGVFRINDCEWTPLSLPQAKCGCPMCKAPTKPDGQGNFKCENMLNQHVLDFFAITCAIELIDHNTDAQQIVDTEPGNSVTMLIFGLSGFNDLGINIDILRGVWHNLTTMPPGTTVNYEELNPYVNDTMDQSCKGIIGRVYHIRAEVSNFNGRVSTRILLIESQ